MSGLRALNERLRASNLSVPRQLFAVTLALGFYLRDLAHILVALAANRPPQLKDHDVTTRSPVASLDESPRVDAVARVLACSFGVGCLLVVPQAERPIFVSYLVANAPVPLADPALFLVSMRDT